MPRDLYGRVVQTAGRLRLLVQTATDERGHSKLAETQYLALLTALIDRVSSGHRPEPDDIGRAAGCWKLQRRGAAISCAKRSSSAVPKSSIFEPLQEQQKA